MSKVSIGEKSPSWILDDLDTATGKIPQISTDLKVRDILGFWQMRWGIGRMNYRVEPGLYAIGSPGPDSPILVSANYKMSFDILRRAMVGNNAWVLVIDTKGVNVWCAAGKHTFSTGAVLWQIKLIGLKKVAPNGTIILPQLSASGVKAHEVQKVSGLRTIFGPVRADDIPAFLNNRMKATTEMRKVKFGIIDRLVLTPVELKHAVKYLLILLSALFFLGGIGLDGFSPDSAWKLLIASGAVLTGAVISGTVITPILLPWIPGRAFSAKGAQVGIIWALTVFAYKWDFLSAYNLPVITGRFAALFTIPAISAYLALNFTGSTTYTSMSGVRKEMRLALPVIIGAGIIGVLFFLMGLIMR